MRRTLHSGIRFIVRSAPLLGLFVVLLGSVSGATQVQPSDDTDRVPGFRDFASRLSAAVRARDAAFVRTLVTDQTDLGFSMGRNLPGDQARALRDLRSSAR